MKFTSRTIQQRHKSSKNGTDGESRVSVFWGDNDGVLDFILKKRPYEVIRPEIDLTDFLNIMNCQYISSTAVSSLNSRKTHLNRSSSYKT